MKKFLFGFLFVLALLAPVARVFAEDVAAVKTRMAQRIPEINTLKAKGVVGENNHGMLELRSAADEAEKTLVDAENKDRQAAYAYLAQQTSTSVEQVSRVRAQKIAQTAPAGVWVQEADGSWKKK